MSTLVTSYRVAGMSCQHCVDSVTAEVGRLNGVEQVEVDLGSGIVAVTSTVALDRADVRAALDEAGYDLTGGDDLTEADEPPPTGKG